MSSSLLTHADGPAVTVVEGAGSSPFLLVCEHASHVIPARLRELGLDAVDRLRHIAWDIGAADVAKALARRLECPLILQNYSRLVCDCNRAIHQPDFIPRTSDGTVIPGNQALSAEERQRRIEEIYAPFHRQIAQAIETRRQRNQLTWLVAIHSFTPVLGGKARPWDVGVLYEQPSSLSEAVLAALRSDSALCVGDNEPYSLHEVYSETMHRHGTLRNIPSIEIEVRQDHISERAAAAVWAERIYDVLRRLRPG